MRCYLILGHKATIHTKKPTSIPNQTILVESIKELDQVRFPLPRLVSIWNALPGAEPLKRFRDRPAALKRVWAALEALPISPTPADSKQSRMIVLLERAAGASMDDLMNATGWQRHSVRGVISGVVRKKLGLRVISKVEGDRRVYRIAS